MPADTKHSEMRIFASITAVNGELAIYLTCSRTYAHQPVCLCSQRLLCAGARG